MKKKVFYLIIVFLIIASLVAFGRIAGNDFIHFDDDLYITANDHIKSGIHCGSIQWAFTTARCSNWHPLTWLSHTMDWSFFGHNAGGHHLISLFLHIGAAIFLFLFLNKTTNRLWTAAFAVAFFALHPLRVESVAWAAERKDVLSMFFGMTTIYAYAFYAESPKRLTYLLCLMLFALSLMSKAMMVTLPFVMLLLDYWPLKRCKKASPAAAKEKFEFLFTLIREKIPFFLLTILSSVLTVWAQHKYGAMVRMESIPLPERFYNAVMSCIAYLEKTFWPVHLAVFYPFEMSLSLSKVIFAAAILLLITVFVICRRKKMPFLLTGWFLYLGTLVPVIGLVQVGEQAMADRYSYLPSIGIAIMIAWGIPNFINRESIKKRLLFPAALTMLVLLAVITFKQCGYWKNSVTLFSQTLRVTKNNHKIHHNLGVTFFKQGKIREAFFHFDQAIKMNPSHLSYNSRGEIFAREGRYREALEDFNRAIALNASDANGYYNRGLTYATVNQYQLALADFNRAISLNSEHVPAYNNRGIVHARINQHQQAIEDFTRALSIKPDYVEAYMNRGITHLSQGRRENGCSDAQKACALGNCKIMEAAHAQGLCR